MLKALIVIGFIFSGNFFASEIGDENLNQLREQIHQRALSAVKFGQYAKFVLENDTLASEIDKLLIQEFEAMNQSQGESPLITLRSIATKDDAAAARAYYLGLKENLFAVTIVLAFEMLALQASSDAMNSEERSSLNDTFKQSFENMRAILGAGIAVECRPISTIDEAIAARNYYLKVRENLFARTVAMTEGAFA